MAGIPVEATLEGFVTFEGGTTVNFTPDNTGTASVEIVDPDQKKK